MKFWKMHGLGNDYVVIDNRDGKIHKATVAELSRRLCNRRFSIGADGLLLVFNSNSADVKMRIFNADGSEAEMCGNGIRCFAKYCYENNITQKANLTVETLAGVKQVWLTLQNDQIQSIRVDMGLPVMKRCNIPMRGEDSCINEDLTINGETYKVTCLSVGNPHCVIFVDDLDSFPVNIIGPKIENHHLFPKRTNVEFVQVLNRSEMKVRVWERGCGETLACGTGACAAVVAGKTLQKVEDKVTVHLIGGDLDIEYANRLFLNGPAEKVFEGTLLQEKRMR
jgi:diaminopimelate epimerase